MPGCHRKGLVLDRQVSVLSAAPYVTVNAQLPGGVMTATPVGAVILLEAGHGFRNGDRIMHYSVVNDLWTFYGGSSVQSSGATSITMSGGTYPDLQASDLVFNMGQDSGGTDPLWNSEALPIYSDLSMQAPITNSEVVADAAGRYEYYWDGQRAWEIVRSLSGDPIGYELEIGDRLPTVLYGSVLPTYGDFPGQHFHLYPGGTGDGALVYVWAQDSAGDFHWEEDVHVA